MTKQHVKPCDNCPFLKKSAGMFFSGHERVEEIAEELRSDGHFTCHKTLQKKEKLICAGSMLTTQKGGDRPSQLARVAMRLGLLDWGKLLKVAATDTETFDSLDLFVEGHNG